MLNVRSYYIEKKIPVNRTNGCIQSFCISVASCSLEQHHRVLYVQVNSVLNRLTSLHDIVTATFIKNCRRIYF